MSISLRRINFIIKFLYKAIKIFKLKKAIAYIRISDEEQSHFSIEAQQRQIEEYCERHSITLHRAFIDEGFSAKNFDRPAWKELKVVLDKNRGQFAYLIVYKYDRMIRNAMEGLSQLHELEQKHRLTIISVCENLGLDPHSPYFKKVRADILVHAEFERNVISDRVKTGMNQAMRNGRYLHQAPFGYLNSRDEMDRPLIIVDETKREIIRMIFNRYIAGDRIIDILATVRKSFPLKGKSPITRIIANPVYTAMVKVPAYRAEPEKMVEAIHEPIIDRTTWWNAQSRRNGETIQISPKVTSELMPLRGYIHCENGHPYTGSLCTGRKGKKYAHYMCNHCKPKTTVAAMVAHSDLELIMQSISMEPALVESVKRRTAQLLSERIKDQSNRKSQLVKQANEFAQLIRSTEDKFIRDQIGPDTYKRQMEIHSRGLAAVQMELEQLSSNAMAVEVNFTKYIDMLSNLKEVFNMAGVSDKGSLIKMLFPAGLIRTKHTYQTAIITPLLTFNPTIGAPLKITGESLSSNSPVGGPGGGEIKPLLQLIARICA